MKLPHASNTGNIEDTVTALEFEPDLETMFQAKDGTWRYKKGTVDEFGKNIGGHFVKGSPSPNPSGRTKLDAAVMDFVKSCSMDAAQYLYHVMMDDSEQTKLRVRCAEEILNRSLGKAAQQIKLEQTNPLDFIRPILIPAGYSPVENDDPYVDKAPLGDEDGQ